MRIRTRSMVIAFGRATTQAVTLGSAIVLVRVISKDMLGTYRQVLLVATLLMGVLGMNLPASLYYFIPKLGPGRRRQLMLQTFGLSFLAAGVISAVMYFGAGPIAKGFNNAELAPLLRIFSLYPFAYLILLLVPAFMISIDRAVRAVVYTLLREGLRVVVVLSLVWMHYSLATILWWLVVASMALAVVCLFDIYRLSPGGEGQPDQNLLVSQMGYVLPMLAATVVAVLNLQFDKLVISSFFDPARFAVYSCGAFQLPVISIITSSIFVAIMPDLVCLWDKQKKNEVIRLWDAAVRKSSLLIYPCFALLVVCAVDFIVLIYGRDYREAAWPFLIYLFVLPIRVAMYGAILRAVGKTRPIAVGAAVGLVTNIVATLALVYLARRLYGEDSRLAFVAPSVGTLVAAFAVAAYMLRQISRTIALDMRKVMPWKDLGVVMVLSAGAALLVFVLPIGFLPLIVRLLIRGGVFVFVLPLLFVVTGTLQEDEKRMLALPLRLARKAFGRINRSS